MDTRFMVSEKEYMEEREVEHVVMSYTTKYWSQFSELTQEQRLDLMDWLDDNWQMENLLEKTPEEILALL